MISKYEKLVKNFIKTAVEEDIGDGDHSSQACIPEDATGEAQLLIKDRGILAGVEITARIFTYIDPELSIQRILYDGQSIMPGEIAFRVSGKIHSILQAERLVLNVMQRMSGIATQTNQYVKKIEGLHTSILDTRKTTPGIRFLEKEAVRIGGGTNHRMGLHDMILLKDNHIDYAGSIETAIIWSLSYLERTHKELDIVVEARTLKDVELILKTGGVRRILLDNFTIPQTRAAVALVNGQVKTESSGGITLKNVRKYAECGVDFISIGALTHQLKSLDMSLKAVK
jgi:nicotinate-nucleotide pyrophosphorylase (carboxylating)